jgi:hypothetical protein
MTTLVLAFAFLFAQVGNAAAAPLAVPLAQDTTPITGTIDTIVVEPDANGDPVVVVTLEDGQIYHFSVETAITLDLLVLDENGEPVLDPETGLPQADSSQEGQPIEFLPTDVISEEEEEETVHPISALLGAFFDVDASVIDGYHEDGFGFGVIAQALWMSENLAADASLTEDILLAKQDKDFEAFFTAHPEYEEYFGDTLPTNWGQFKKGLLQKKNNLGSVVSGQAEAEDSSQSLNSQGNGQGNGNGNGQGNGKGNGQGNGKGNGKGKGHNK